MTLALALLLAGVGTALSPDTLLDLREGDRLLLHDVNGQVVVDVWDQAQLGAEVNLGDGGAVSFHRHGSRIQAVHSGRGAHRRVDIRLRVPAWLAVEITGRNLDLVLRGLHADVSVQTLRGDVLLRDLRGPVNLYATDGDVEASGLGGPARLRTGDAELTVLDSDGDLELETVDGEITLRGIESRNVVAQTTDGEVDFEGSFLSGGDYRFTSHDGDITIRVSPPVDVNARILTYGGTFRSDFPVQARTFRSGEGMEFTLGSGGAVLTAETFSGDIRLHDGRTSLRQTTNHVNSNNGKGEKR